MNFYYYQEFFLCSQSDSGAVWITFFQISRWAVVNHGEALKTDQILARKQFPQNVIVCPILPRSTNCLHRQKPTAFCTISQVLFVLGQNHREWCGRVTFSRSPGPDVQAAEFVQTDQNPTEQFKIQDCLGTSLM